MKRLLMMVVLGLACFACGNECDDAADKFEECGFEGEKGDTDECDGQSECVAKCTNEHSCTEINDPTFSSPYWQCVANCA